MSDILSMLKAQRVDIVETNGDLRISLYNSASQPSTLPAGASGMAFFDCDGQEYGGLVLQSAKTAPGFYESNLSLTFGKSDKQAVQAGIREENGIRRYGYTIYDKISGENAKDANCDRLFVGKEPDGSLAVRLKDSKGIERINLILDNEGETHIVVYDASGSIISSLKI
ncbi:MAG: hypothetical protein FWE76_04050 [Symbiobacteriaceae bacterium]|nr:hypothetical protein [Symbiobacteriaceae bacterium]